MRRARQPSTLAVALVSMAGYGARPLRWQLRSCARCDLCGAHLLAISNIGCPVRSSLPARGSDFAWLRLVGARDHIGAARAFCIILGECIYQALLGVPLLAAMGRLIPLPAWAVKGGLTVGAVTVTLTALLVWPGSTAGAAARSLAA